MTKSVLRYFAIKPVISFLKNTKDLDPFYKIDLDFRDCFGKKESRFWGLFWKEKNSVLEP